MASVRVSGFTNTFEQLNHLRMKVLVVGVEGSRKIGTNLLELLPLTNQVSNQQILVVFGQEERRLNAVFVARIAEGDEQFLCL